MTFDPKHDYEDESSAKLRFGGKLYQRSPCPCHVCRMFELEDGPILEPWTQTLPDGRRRRTGRWLHGAELKAKLAQRREMFDGMKRVLASHVMVER
jgi:hypothetical protein